MTGLKYSGWLLAALPLVSLVLPDVVSAQEQSGQQVLAPADGATILMAPKPAWVPLVEDMPVPADARGLIFFRSQATFVHFGANGQMAHNSYRVRLLHPNALQLGNLAFEWRPASGSPIVHKVVIHRDGEVIDVLADHAFEILRRETMLEASFLTGSLTATLQVPDLRVGDELEVSYTLPSTNPTFPETDFGLAFLAGDPPPGRFRIGVLWEDGHEPALRTAPDLAPLLQRTANALIINADNPPAIAPPHDAPPRYLWSRIIEYSDFSSWNDISQRLHALFADARRLAPDSPLKREAERIAARHTDNLARASAALELVELQTRYIFVGLNQGGLTPVSADETWARRYGDCKGKTALLLALLDELGIEAEPVLVSNSTIDDGMDQRLPGLGQFDHVLVRAKIDGQTYWLDGTYPSIARPTLHPILPYRWVLPLSAAGETIEHIPYRPHDVPQEISLMHIDASDGFDAPARVRQRTILRGVAALAQYAQFSAATDQQIEAAYRNQLVGNEQWATVDDVTYRFDVEQQASILEYSGTKMEDWEDERGEGRSMTLPGGGFRPPARRQRSTDQDQTAPFALENDFVCHVTTVQLPQDTEARRWSYNTTVFEEMFGRSYRRNFERRGMVLRMMRISRAHQDEISVEDAALNNARIANFDNSMAKIEYDPVDNFNAPADQPVPTMDEWDFVADPSPCFPEMPMIHVISNAAR